MKGILYWIEALTWNSMQAKIQDTYVTGTDNPQTMLKERKPCKCQHKSDARKPSYEREYLQKPVHVEWKQEILPI